MIYVFVPYYHKDTKAFEQSLASQVVEYKLIRRNRKRDKIYWTKACNDFYRDIRRYRGVKDDDVVCIMNNDISFPPGYLTVGGRVKQGQIFVCDGISIDWSKKKFYKGDRLERAKKISRIKQIKNLQNSVYIFAPKIAKIDTFPGRAFFMTYKDFKNSGGFSVLLPHHFADIDFGIKMIKKGLRVYEIVPVIHKEHQLETKLFSLLNPNNPFIWTIFLLKHFNRYTFINIIKAWVTALRLLKQQHVTKSILTVRDGI